MDGTLELATSVESLEASNSLLAVDRRRNTVTVLRRGGGREEGRGEGGRSESMELVMGMCGGVRM